MEWVLALVACAVALVACIQAVRATGAAHRLALEMVQLRDRLARAERTRRDADARASVDVPPAGEGEASSLAPRLQALEGRLRAVLVEDLDRGGAPSGDDAASDPRATVRRHLQALGYERVAFLDLGGDGGMVVEAERAGVTSKARAVIGPDGAVTLDEVRSSVRAFP